MIKIMTQTPPPAAAPIIGSVFDSIFSVFVLNFSLFPNKYEHNQKEIYYLPSPPALKNKLMITIMKLLCFTYKIKDFLHEFECHSNSCKKSFICAFNTEPFFQKRLFWSENGPTST